MPAPKPKPQRPVGKLTEVAKRPAPAAKKTSGSASGAKKTGKPIGYPLKDALPNPSKKFK